jgi:hypothetical protein
LVRSTAGVMASAAEMARMNMTFQGNQPTMKTT